MAKRDILKEAIADAKAVKETAIANAKAALEEAFTPQLKSMLAAKLEEMELEEDAEALEEKKKYSDDNRPKRDKGVKGGAEEREELKMKEKIKKGSLEEEDLDEEIDLDEILAEIELDEEKDDLKEDERTRAEEEGYLDGKEDGEEEEKKDMEDEEIDLDDMTDDDLKGFIEDVIADMVASGELEAGENFEEEDEETEEIVDTTDVDVEISEAKKDKEEDDKEKVKESIDIEESTDIDEVNTMGGGGSVLVKRDKDGNPLNKFDRMSNEELAKYLADKITSGAKGAAGKILGGVKKLFGLSEDLNEFTVNPYGGGSSRNNKFDRMSNTEVAKYFLDKLKAGGEKFRKTVIALLTRFKLEEAEYMEEELSEAYSTIETLKSDLNEVNLLNAKLLYTNKIFKAKTLTESQKVKVLGAFDKASTVKESKLVYETLNEGLKAKKAPIKESLGTASRVSGNINTKKPIIETDPMVERFKKLAGLK